MVVEEQGGIAVVKPAVNVRNYLEGLGMLAAAEPSAPTAPSRTEPPPVQPPKPVTEPASPLSILTVRSNVWGDTVYIDGERRGSTRLDLELPPGPHDVRVEKEGYEPYEAKVELAARAGTTTAQFWGERSDRACDFANVADKSLKGSYPDFQWTIHDCDDRFVHTAPVGTYQANNFGLRDMLGNAWEWTEDCWNDSYKGTPADGRAWAKGDCGRRVVRGGSWGNKPEVVRAANRSRGDTEDRDGNLGFRPARTF
jgi:hypothetical protein